MSKFPYLHLIILSLELEAGNITSGGSVTAGYSVLTGVQSVYELCEI